MPLAKAKQVLTAAGFRVGKITYDEKAKGPVWRVLKQAPEAGDRVSAGSVIELTVSGHPPVATPDLAGLTRASADATLTAAGLRLGRVTESYDASVTAGVLVSQQPTAGVDAPRGSAVAVVISKGPEPVDVPIVTGKPEQEASSILAAAGFQVSRSEKPDSASKGTVIGQEPSSGKAQPGTAVAITVSSGVEMVTVPDLYKIMGQIPGLDFDTPYSAIEAFINKRIAHLGLRVHVVTADYYGPDKQQSPRAGTRVRRGTTITLGVGD